MIDNVRRHALIPALVALLGALACGLPGLAPAPTQTPEIVVATPEGESAAPDAQALPDLAVPSLEPTPPAPLAIWPLPADLFYLDEEGRLWRQPASGDQSAARQVLLGEGAITDFALAPGADWIMVRAGQQVIVSTLDGLRGQVIAGVAETGDLRVGRTAAWSPDGTRLAFATARGFQVYLRDSSTGLAPRLFQVQVGTVAGLAWSYDGRWLLTLAEDGAATLYTAQDALQAYVDLGRLTGFTWLTDGRLAFAPAGGGLALVDPSNLDTRSFLVPQDRLVTLPHQRPDGSLVFFMHEGAPDAPGVLYSASPDTLGFQVESSLPVQTAGLAWDPTGVLLLGIDDEAFSLLDPRSGSSANFEPDQPPAAAMWAPLPPPSADGVKLPADLFFIAPQAGIDQVWRLPATGSPAAPVTAAAQDVLDFSVSPDGAQIVFTSGGTVYRQVLNTLDITTVAVLTAGRPGAGASPAFAPGGRQVAYADGGIWIADLDSGQARLVLPDQPGADELSAIHYAEPRWSPDGAWLLLRVQYFEAWDQAMLHVGEPLVGPYLFQALGANAEWSYSGAALIYSAGDVLSTPGVSQVFPPLPGEDGTLGETHISQLLSLPVVDLQPRTDGRLILLHLRAPGSSGPASADIYSAAVDGTDLRAASGAILFEAPVLSPAGDRVAGLISTRYSTAGYLVGQPAIFDVASGQTVAINGINSARALRWGS